MQNSGTNEDINVSYISYDGIERMISSQNYDTALAFARDRAQHGEKVTLILNKPKKHSKHHRKHNEMRKEHKEHDKHRHDKHHRKSRSPKQIPMTSAGVEKSLPRMPAFFEKLTREYNHVESEDECEESVAPPEWFTTYMANFKEEIEVMLRHSMFYNIDMIELMVEAAERRRENVSKDRRRKHSHVSKCCEEEISTDEFTSETIPLQISNKLIRKVQKIQAKEKKLERRYEAKIGKLESKVKRIVKKTATVAPSKPSKQKTSSNQDEFAPKPKKRASAETKIGYVSGASAPPGSSAQIVEYPESIQSATQVLKPESYGGTPLNAVRQESIQWSQATSSTQVNQVHQVNQVVEFPVAGQAILKPEHSPLNAEKPEPMQGVQWKYLNEEEKSQDQSLFKMVNMNAHPLHRQMHCEYVNRGEIVTKTWEVMNTGLTAWSDETCLCFTWGSSSLVPLAKCVKVPKLKPGDVGVISVQMQAPDAVGRFESYWHFFHNNARFGQWLGCVYVILPPTTKEIKTKAIVHTGTTDDMKLFKEIGDTKEVVLKPESYQGSSNQVQSESMSADTTAVLEPEKMNIIGDEDDNHSDSDSDNISVISGTISVTSATDQGEEFVMIKMPIPVSRESESSCSSSDSETSEISCPELIELEEKPNTPDLLASGHSSSQDPEMAHLFANMTIQKPEKHFTEVEQPSPIEKKPLIIEFNPIQSLKFPSPEPVVESPVPDLTPIVVIRDFNNQEYVSRDAGDDGRFVLNTSRAFEAKPETENERFVFNANEGKAFEVKPEVLDREFDFQDRLSSRYAYIYEHGNKPVPTVEENVGQHSDDLKAVHILPETIVNGAIQVASNAFNTACNVYELIRGTTEDAVSEHSSAFTNPNTRGNSPLSTSQRSSRSSSTYHWTDGNPPQTPLDRSLKMLHEMGFSNRALNLKLLKRYNNDISTVISKLI